MKQKKSEFSIADSRMKAMFICQSRMKAMFICQSDLTNVVRLTSNIQSKNT